MAGAGAKKFPAFSKLASDDVNNYLADQVIMRFATTAARDAAFGGVGEPTLAEGMTAYIDDLNVIQTYDGSNWVTTTALQTTANVSSGLVYIKSQTITAGVPSVTVTDAFSATYDHYRIVISGLNNSTGSQLRFSLPTITTGYYYGTPLSATAGGAFASNSLANAAFIDLGNIPATWLSDFSFDVMSPFKTTATKVTGFGYLNSISFGGVGDGIVNTVASSTGFTLTPSAGTLTSGIIYIYGYRI
jgi:hypothetical protein